MEIKKLLFCNYHLKKDSVYLPVLRISGWLDILSSPSSTLNDPVSVRPIYPLTGYSVPSMKFRQTGKLSGERTLQSDGLNDNMIKYCKRDQITEQTFDYSIPEQYFN